MERGAGSSVGLKPLPGPAASPDAGPLLVSASRRSCLNSVGAARSVRAGLGPRQLDHERRTRARLGADVEPSAHPLNQLA